MEQIPEAKSARLLSIYARLLSGQTLGKAELAVEYNVTTRSIQRDIESLRYFLADQGLAQDVVFDRTAKGYRLANIIPKGLSNSEILAVCKILLESRSMRKDEMLPILDKLIDCAVPKESQKAVKSLIANEQRHYMEPHHHQPILNGLWEIGQAVKNRQIIQIEYERMKEPKLVSRRVQPVGIMFSEYYFYLTAFLEKRENFETPEDLFPTIYRIDRVQFMYGGKLETIRFRYTGPSLEAVLDRLPTARVIAQDEEGWMISAEVFGKGIDMWLRSQGDYVKDVNAI